MANVMLRHLLSSESHESHEGHHSRSHESSEEGWSWEEWEEYFNSGSGSGSGSGFWAFLARRMDSYEDSMEERDDYIDFLEGSYFLFSIFTIFFILAIIGLVIALVVTCCKLRKARRMGIGRSTGNVRTGVFPATAPLPYKAAPQAPTSPNVITVIPENPREVIDARSPPPKYDQ